MAKAKRSLSSMDIAVLVREFQSLIGAHIRKAYQPEREVVVIRLNTKEGRKELVIRTGRTFFLSSKGPENPPQPTGFAMMLRKYLNNGRIISVEQQEFDRIIIIGVQKEERYDLIIEGFGDGNVILVKEGKIVQPLISRTWRHRVVRAGREYEVPPPMTNPRTLEKEGFFSILGGSERDVVRTLAMDVNLGGVYAEEVCLRGGVEKDRLCTDLSLGERDALWKEIAGLFEELEELTPGIVILEDGDMVNVLPFPLRIYEGSEYNGSEYVTYESFNEGVEEYFSSLISGSGDGVGTGGAGRGAGGSGSGDGDGEGGAEVKDSAEVERIRRTIEQQEQTIVKFEEAIGENKEKAERLFLRYAEFEKVLGDIKKYGEVHGWKEMAESLSGHDLVLEINTAKKFVVLKDEPTNLRLDYMHSVNENAQRYYEAASKARDKLEGAKVALEESRVTIKRVKKHESKIRERKRTERKTFWFERYRWFISSEGNIIVGGKDAATNDRVVKKYLKERDRYAHAEIHGAPSCVIKVKQNEEEIGEQTLNEACVYAACFSRAWSAGIGGVEAYWVTPDQVSKTPAAGEFIARGAFIIRGRRNRIHADLRLAIGNIEHEGVEMIMCGPESAVVPRAERYILFEPGGSGDVPKNEAAKNLSRAFNVKNEEILSIIPGDVRIVRSKGIDLSDLSRSADQ